MKPTLPTLLGSRSFLPSSMWLTLLLAAGMLALSAPRSLADRATYDPTKTMIAFPLSTPPVIDGDITDEEWLPYSSWSITVNPLIADGIQGGAMVGGSVLPADNDDLSCQIRARYDATNLYLAVRVRDSSIQTDSADPDSKNGNTWMDDGVEVFVDGANANDAAWAAGQLGGQFVITANNAYRENEAGNPGYGETAAWFAKTTVTATGYDAEFRISLSILGNPKPGDIIGLNIAVNDDDDGGDAERQVSWSGQSHKPVTYGNLLLGPPSYSAPKVASAPTVDGVINAAEYAGAAEIKLDPTRVVYSLDEGDDLWTATDQTFSFRVVHTTDAVYVAVNVIDDQIVNDTVEPGGGGNVWQDDSVEVLFDAKNERGLSVTLGAPPFEGQWMNFTANNAWRDSTSTDTETSTDFGPAKAWFAATAKTANGYQIEFVIQKSALLNPLDGATVGFDVALNDDDNVADTARLQPKTYSLWSGHEFQPFTYGNLTLQGAGGSTNTNTEITITSIKMNGDKLELSFTSPQPASAHALEQAAKLPASAWTDMTNVTFAGGPGNTLTATVAKPSSSPEFYRVRLGDKPAGASCITTPALDSWVNTPLTNQTGIFTAQFDATPSANLIDGVMALSSGAQTAFGNFACLVRFSNAGVIEARNGGAYQAASAIPYSANVQYSFRLAANIPNHTYSVYVTPAGGAEQTVGTDFAFRTEQNTVTNLNNWAATLTSSGAAGSNTVCNFRVTSSTPACITTPAINSWVNTPYPNQTNTFTARFDATPSEDAPLDVVMALSSGPKTAFGDFACLVRFQTNGTIDARNGGAYEAASEIPFSANVKYSFRLVVNIPNQTYSVYVTAAGGAEQLVGMDFAFRPTAGTITNLNNWGAIDDSQGSATICNFRVSP
jgi:hypothetical protein